MNEHQQNCGENDVAGKVQNTLEDVLMISVPARILSSVVDMASSHVEDIESGLKDGTYDPSENRELPQKQAATNEAHRLYREAMLAESARLREECADRKVVEKYFRVNYYVPNATGSDGFEDGHDFFCKATSENEAAKKLEAEVPNAAGLTFEEIGEEDVLTAHGINVYESNDVPGNWGFTGCDSDCYESEADATSAALESAHVTRKVVENALIRLTFDVEYMPNGSSIEQLKANLEDVARLAVNEGMLTAGTESEVEDYKFEAVVNPFETIPKSSLEATQNALSQAMQHAEIVADAVASAVLDACKRQVEKGRSLDGLNLDVIKDRVTRSLYPDNEQDCDLPSPGM